MPLGENELNTVSYILDPGQQYSRRSGVLQLIHIHLQLHLNVLIADKASV